MVFDTKSLVREAHRLEPLPQAVTRLLAIFVRDDWRPEEVLAVVRLDPVLTGKVLGAANSASAGTRTRILDLADAVRRIGPRAVVGLAIAAGAKAHLSRALPQLGLAEGELWRHSVAALLAAELAPDHFRLRPSPAAATAALLHDVGKVLLARFLDPETLDYLRLACLESGRTVHEAEHVVLSLSHGELGALVAAHWGMPEAIVRAVHHHHDLESAPEEARVDAALVQLADSTAKAVAPPRIAPLEDPRSLALALEVLGLRAEALPAFREAVRERLERLGDAY
jgi:putative nucleotidyltransferase with HDIG domain